MAFGCCVLLRKSKNTHLNFLSYFCDTAFLFLFKKSLYWGMIEYKKLYIFNVQNSISLEIFDPSGIHFGRGREDLKGQ